MKARWLNCRFSWSVLKGYDLYRNVMILDFHRGCCGLASFRSLSICEWMQSRHKPTTTPGTRLLQHILPYFAVHMSVPSRGPQLFFVCLSWECINHAKSGYYQKSLWHTRCSETLFVENPTCTDGFQHWCAWPDEELSDGTQLLIVWFCWLGQMVSNVIDANYSDDRTYLEGDWTRVDRDRFVRQGEYPKSKFVCLRVFEEYENRLTLHTSKINLCAWLFNKIKGRIMPYTVMLSSDEQIQRLAVITMIS